MIDEVKTQSLFFRLFFTVEEGELGYTTLGMVVALLVTLSLLFTSAQVYRLSSASVAIQDVADVSALAAENQVGQFMVVVRVCDALVLSMSLTSLAATGLGIAASCTPVTASFAPTLLEAGTKIAQARVTFARGASEVLEAYQQTLPFLSAASAWGVAKKNNDASGGSNYLALAILVPDSGEDIMIKEFDEVEDAQDAADEEAGDLQEDASRAEEAAKRANEAKERAFMADCGNNPGYCMYERAASLAGLREGDNPLYTSVDVWSFAVALERARAYYQARYVGESPASNSVRELGRSALRKNVYGYACALLGKGYVHDTGGSFDAYLPVLPKNTAEMRTTSLYTEAVYPLTYGPDGPVLHSTPLCPAARGCGEYGSVRDMEEGDYATCGTCEFSAGLLGSVCSASTSISNGFEYHYRIVAEAAQDYEEARGELDPLEQEVKEEASSLFELLMKAFDAVGDYRIEAKPPGSLGVIVLVVDVSQSGASEGFETSFVQSDAALGTRAAVSAATLLADPSDDQNSVITQVIEGFEDQSGKAGAIGIVLRCWNALLYVYGEGQAALTKGIEDAIQAIPFASQSGLGTWASKKLEGLIDGLGLEPAKCDSLKPVVVNTGLVAEKDQGGFAVRYLAVKNAVVTSMGGSVLFESVVSDVEANLVEKVSGEIELATIQPLGSWGPSFPITIALPQAAKEASVDVISWVAEGVRGILPRMEGESSWR